MVTHELLPFQFIEMSKFIALFAYRKVHEKTSMYRTVVWLIIIFKKKIQLPRNSYLQFSTFRYLDF